MKLKEWAEKTGISYITSYRWFKAGILPVKAFQTESGTIIVEDNSISENQAPHSSTESVSLFLNKVVEFSKNNSTIEEFAAEVLSNFNLNFIDSSKSSKIKSKTFMYLPENKEAFGENLVKTDLTSQGSESLCMSENSSITVDINNSQQELAASLNNINNISLHSKFEFSNDIGASSFNSSGTKLFESSLDSGDINFSAMMPPQNSYFASKGLLSKPKRGRPRKK